MNSRAKAVVFFLAAFAAITAGWTRSFASEQEQGEAGQRARAVVASWPIDSRLMALKILDELGPPDEVMTRDLAWFRRAPFLTVAIYSDRAASNRPGVLVHTVRYYAPKAKLVALAAFGHGISYDYDDEILLACSDSLETNLLALNLANDVAYDWKSVLEASEFYAKTMRRYNAGAGSYYLRQLLFPPLPETPEFKTR